MSRNESELHLQSRLRSADKKALGQIYVQHKTAFLNYAVNFNISKTIATDIYQDAIIALYQSFVVNKLELEKSSIKTYLFGIGKHKIYQYLKQQKRLTNTGFNEDNSYETIDLKEDVPTLHQKQLSKHLKQISESCQTILKLFYYRGLTIDEIVEQTDYKDSATVRSHKSRCMKRLKTLFKVV